MKRPQRRPCPTPWKNVELVNWPTELQEWAIARAAEESA